MNFVQPIREIEKVDEIKRYLIEGNERDYILFVVGVYTGLRISDILNLTIGDVRGDYISIREKKTKKQKRIPVNPALKRELKPFISGKKDEEFLIKSRNGKNKSIDRTTAYRILQKAAKKAKLDDIGTHTLRKTFGFHFYQQTKDVVTLQQLFNHSSPQVTLKYIGVNQDMMDKAILKFKL